VSRPKIQVERVLSIPFEENCYIAHIEGKTDCLVVDPGLEPQKIVDYLDSNALVPVAILNTHGHSDHIAGNGFLKERWPDAPLLIGSVDAAKLTSSELNLSSLFGASITSPAPDRTLVDGQTYSAGGLELTVLAIPGHSAGHVVYLCQNHNPPLVFVGDVIFSGSIGRTDFPDGSFQQLRQGIHAKLFTLPDETLLFPGHGPPTSVAQEKRSNPFVGLGS